MKVFNYYSTYYDLFYNQKNYKKEVKQIKCLIDEHQPKATQLLDLGCGTGKHAFHFSKLGYQVDGIDVSEKMVEIANSKLVTDYKNQATKLNFLVADITKFRSKKKYDVVVSLFHVMSYQVSNKKFNDALKTAHKHLKKGGIFIFDFWYGSAVLNDLPEVRIKKLSNKEIEIIRIAEPQIDKIKNTVDVNYTIMAKEKGTNYMKEFEEKHSLRYFFIPEIKLFINKKFKLLNSFSTFNKEELTNSNWNGIVVLKKS